MSNRSWLLLSLCLSCPALAFGQGDVHYQSHFPPEEFKARWEKIFERLGDKGVAMVQGMPKVNGFILPRQNNEFYYLCGIESPHAYLVLDGKTRKVKLYLPPRDARLESQEGRILSANDAELVKRVTGADEVLSNKAMNEDQLPEFAQAEAIYTLFSPAEGYLLAPGRHGRTRRRQLHPRLAPARPRLLDRPATPRAG